MVTTYDIKYKELLQKFTSSGIKATMDKLTSVYNNFLFWHMIQIKCLGWAYYVRLQKRILCYKRGTVVNFLLSKKNYHTIFFKIKKVTVCSCLKLDFLDICVKFFNQIILKV